MWSYSISENTWTHLSGNRSKNVNADYILSYPGGVQKHAMSITLDHIYVFGGDGYIPDTPGILYRVC